MNLPVEISPDPILTSTVEVRFSSTLNDDDVLNIFYSAFGKEFPKIVGKVPTSMKKQNPALEYSPDYALSNDDYSLSFAKNSIAFENIGRYHFWTNYFPFIQEKLVTLSKLQFVTSVNRVGVRYASIFDGQSDINKVLKNPIAIGFKAYSEEIQSLQINLKKDDINLFLQIIPNAKSSGEKGNKTGFYIDIDASFIGDENLKINEDLFKIIDRLHNEEKELFFSLLNQDFLNSLNPRYQ